LPFKNTLTLGDAQAVEAGYVAKLKVCSDEHVVPVDRSDAEPSTKQDERTQSAITTAVIAPLPKPVRRRSKAHLAFVASQPCLVCKTAPCDAQHLKVALPRSLGRKVSDEFTVPLCRKHPQELHRHGNEAN
jgi:hypothetical protein